MAEGKAGQRFKLTAARKTRLLDALKAGNYAYRAAEYAGFSVTSYHDYLRQGEALTQRAYEEGILDPDLVEEAQLAADIAHMEAERRGEDPRRRHRPNVVGDLLRRAGWPENDVLQVELADEVPRAEAEAELRLVTHWSRQAEQDWRGAAALLSRRHPERWRETKGVELTGDGGGPVEITHVTRADLARRITADPEARKIASDLLARVVPSFVPSGEEDLVLGLIAPAGDLDEEPEDPEAIDAAQAAREAVLEEALDEDGGT